MTGVLFVNYKINRRYVVMKNLLVKTNADTQIWVTKDNAEYEFKS